MRVKVKYEMSAYIEADTLEECKRIFEDTNVEVEEQYPDGYIGTEYDRQLEVYNADTLEEIDHKIWNEL